MGKVTFDRWHLESDDGHEWRLYDDDSEVLSMCGQPDVDSALRYVEHYFTDEAKSALDGAVACRKARFELGGSE